jgi:hypothetical protein
MKKDDLGKTHSTLEGNKGAYNILVQNPEGRLGHT